MLYATTPPLATHSKGFVDIDVVCKVCQTDRNPDGLFICDACQDAYHLECLALGDPPEDPEVIRMEDDWFCPSCRDRGGQGGHAPSTLGEGGPSTPANKCSVAGPQATQPTKPHLPDWVRGGMKYAEFRDLIKAIIEKPMHVHDDETLDDNVSKVIGMLLLFKFKNFEN
jgi:hypothetical protein